VGEEEEIMREILSNVTQDNIKYCLVKVENGFEKKEFESDGSVTYIYDFDVIYELKITTPSLLVSKYEFGYYEYSVVTYGYECSIPTTNSTINYSPVKKNGEDFMDNYYASELCHSVGVKNAYEISQLLEKLKLLTCCEIATS
jgi:hypothetical protein